MRAGLQRLVWPIADVHVAEGWTLRRLSKGGLELREPRGGVFSRSNCELPPIWISAAISYGFALVLYGVSIGVRRPPNISANQYSVSMRAAELKQSCRAGIVAAGIVRWA